MNKFKSPVKRFQIGHFKTTKHPQSPSPIRKNYEQKSKTKSDRVSRCTYVNPDTHKRCKNKLGIYPQFCHLHTVSIHNVYIAPSNIPQAGNGLFTGPFGFKKGDIIGQYNQPFNSVKLGQLQKRCDNDNCWSYVFCDDDDKTNYKKTQCWDGLDIRSTLMRNINDAHGSSFKNNAYFDIIDGNVYVVASRNIRPKKEIFVNYGKNYW